MTSSTLMAEKCGSDTSSRGAEKVGEGTPHIVVRTTPDLLHKEVTERLDVERRTGSSTSATEQFVEFYASAIATVMLDLYLNFHDCLDAMYFRWLSCL